METPQDRYTYLDNIRSILVYNVVFVHIICMLAYPITFWWPVIDKNGSSRVYENLLLVMDMYLMPHLIFIAALFIFPSLNGKSTLAYIKKRFFRLFVPVIVFAFCAGEIVYQILVKRLDNSNPAYFLTFLDYWRDFINFNAITFIGEGKMLNQMSFNTAHTWFLSFLFFITLIIVLLGIPFRKKEKVEKEVDSRKKIIIKTITLTVILGFLYTAFAILFTVKGMNFTSWIRVIGLVQVRLDQFFVLLPLFLFGLYMHRKDWLTRGDIGSWKMWGILSAVFIFVFALLYHNLLPIVDNVFKVTEHNLIFSDKIPVPTIPDSFIQTFLIICILQVPACIFLLMFFLSFAKKFFNTPNKITDFCSKHSINVYILHFIPVVLLQYIFVNIPIAPILKTILTMIIIIPACLWLSHRLVYPHPLFAISFFAILKLVSLFAGFNFFYIALLIVLISSFAGAIYESVRILASAKAGRQQSRIRDAVESTESEI
jgi:glucans biosynthesis protein C